MKKSCLYLILCLAGLVITSRFAFSHAHVFIDNSMVFVFDKNGLLGVKLTWQFDEMFGSSVIADFDKNKDHKFSQDEIKKLKAGAFANMKKFCYY